MANLDTYRQTHHIDNETKSWLMDKISHIIKCVQKNDHAHKNWSLGVLTSGGDSPGVYVGLAVQCNLIISCLYSTTSAVICFEIIDIRYDKRCAGVEINGGPRPSVFPSDHQISKSRGPTDHSILPYLV